MKKFLLAVTSFVLIVVSMLCVLPSRDFSFAESDKTYSLVPYDFNAEPLQTKLRYNIDEDHVANFTPFDFEAEKYMPGMSFLLPSDPTTKQVENASVKFKDTDALEKSSGVSLFMWIRFDAYALHNFSLWLNFEDGSNVYWYLSQFELLSIVQKSTVRQIHGWNLIEFPFFSAKSIDGEVEGKKMTSMTINYTSVDISEFEVYSNLWFYNVYVASSTSEDINCNEKQDVLIRSYKELDQNLLGSFIVGDSYTIPMFSDVVRYAFYNDINLTQGADFNGNGPQGYVWVAMVQAPSENKGNRVFSGEKVTFEEEGVYKLTFECHDTKNNILTFHIEEITVREFKPIYFDRTKLNAVTGTKYIINVFSSNVFTSVSDFTISSVSEGLTVNYLGDGKIEVTATKTGELTFEVQVEGERVAKPENEVYSETFTVNARAPEKDNTRLYRILLWCGLGVFGVILVAFVIFLLVKARKFDVK